MSILAVDSIFTDYACYYLSFTPLSTVPLFFGDQHQLTSHGSSLER